MYSRERIGAGNRCDVGTAGQYESIADLLRGEGSQCIAALVASPRYVRMGTGTCTGCCHLCNQGGGDHY